MNPVAERVTGGARARFVTFRSELVAIRNRTVAQWDEELIDLGRIEPLAAWPADPPPREPSWSATRRYQAVGGTPAAREALAHNHGPSAGPLRVSQVALMPGGLAALAASVLTVAGPGDEVILPIPCFPPYRPQIELTGAEARIVDTSETGWRVSPDSVRAACGPRTKALLLSNPVNPTGVVHRAGEMEAICEALDPGVAIIADEVYAEFVYEGSVTPLAAAVDEERNPWLSLRSASKTLGRPGLRIAAILGEEALVAKVIGTAALVTGPPAVPSQAAYVQGMAAARGVSHTAAYRPRRDEAVRRLREAGFEVDAPEGTYYLWAGAPDGARIGTLEGVAMLAERTGVLVQPGEYFGGPPNFVRVSLAAPRATLSEGIERIAQAVDGGLV